VIRVLIVEDDKLVRHGLASAMPWKEFDMQVVGEARNGKEALEFLENNNVDCILTDLAMPVMSGIELMRIVRKKHPLIHIVVLTIHQDFEYIQEALRLGAIDYIAKVQLEKERFEEVLARIHGLILQKNNETLSPLTYEKSTELFDVETGYVLLSADEQADLRWGDSAIESFSDRFLEVGNSIWFWEPDRDHFHETLLNPIVNIIPQQDYWMFIRLEGIAGRNRLEVYRMLRNYRKRNFFYDYSEESKTVTMSICEFRCSANPNPFSETNFALMKDRWLAFDWILDDVLFVRMRDDLKNLRLPPPKLLSLFYDIATAWNQVYGSIVPSAIVVPEMLHCWLEAVRWLQHARETVGQTSNKLQYSQEVVNCIMSAVKIVQVEVNQPLFAVNVAKRVNMSRSYFNRCFKDIVGNSFNGYLRYLRIEKAKDYLLKTSKSIQWIAEQTGYMDEKYFSRVFRQQTHMTPSEFRQKSNRGRSMQS
jgi:two-component system response regulator YesN